MTRKGWVVLVSVVVGVLMVMFLSVGAFAVLVLSQLGTAADWDEHAVIGTGPQKVAMIDVRGEIHGGESTPSLFGEGGAGARDIVSQLRQAEEDPDVVAVLLRVDSPGGAVVASDDIAAAIRRLRESKPVVASMGDLAASGGYYVSAHADRIIANRGTITGSIGVIAVLFNLEGTAEKLGARPVVLRSGDLKDAGSPFREFTDQDRAVFQRLLDVSYEQFVQTVAEGRGMEREQVLALADGRPYSGADALDNGLIDEIGNLETAYDAALELAGVDRDDATLVEYQARLGLGDLFFGFGSAIDEVKRELGLDVGLKYLFVP